MSNITAIALLHSNTVEDLTVPYPQAVQTPVTFTNRPPDKTEGAN